MVIILLGAAQLARVAAYNIQKENKRNEIITSVQGSASKREWWDEGKLGNSSSQISSAGPSSSSKIGAWSRDAGLAQEPESTTETDAVLPRAPRGGKSPAKDFTLPAIPPVVSLESTRRPQMRETSSQTAASYPSSTSSSRSTEALEESPAVTPVSALEPGTSRVLASMNNDEQRNSAAPIAPVVTQSAFANTNSKKRYVHPTITPATNRVTSTNQSGPIPYPLRKTFSALDMSAKHIVRDDTISAGTSMSALPGNAVKAKYSKPNRAPAPTRNAPARSVDLQSSKGTLERLNKTTGQAAVVVQSSLASAGAMKRPVRTGKSTPESLPTVEKMPMKSAIKHGVEPASPLTVTPRTMPVGSSFAAPGALRKRQYREDPSQQKTQM